MSLDFLAFTPKLETYLTQVTHCVIVKPRSNPIRQMEQNMANQILENLNKRSSELAEKSQHFITSAYQKSLDAFGLDEEQVRSRINQLNEQRGKLETTVQNTVSEQLKDLQALEVKFLGRLEEAVGNFKGVVETNYGRLAESLDKLEKRIQDVEKNLSAKVSKLPIEDYDRLNADEIVRKIEVLPADALSALRGYESEHKGRVTILKAIDAKLAA